MATIRDMMPAFELYQPAGIDDVLALLKKHGKDAWVMAGGMDSLEWCKDRVKRPKVVVDLSQVKGLKGIRAQANGVEIGALTTLTEVVTNPLIQSRYGLLAHAARRVASPQIRNQGTLGGNVSQDTRCWYYRNGMPCYRAGGNICYADTPTAANREHCLFGADRCVAVSPSDTAPALIALDAKFVIRSAKGERLVDAEEFFIGPSVDITRNGVIKQARIVVSGVAPRPLRLKAVEDSVRGERLSEETAELAGKTAIWGAKPLNHNHFKIPLMKNLVRRAIRGA